MLIFIMYFNSKIERSEFLLNKVFLILDGINMGYMLRAVVVGINEYGDTRYRVETRLLYAQKDAQEIASALSNSTAFQVEPGNPHVLTNTQATERAVRDAMKNTFSTRSYDRNTIALFYFAGHGIPRDNRIFLCCQDVDFADPEHGGIRLNDVYDWLASSSAECAIAIIDACFSGGIIANRVDYMSAAERAKQAIEALRGPDGKTMVIFAACRGDQEARENRRIKHGIFTYEILRGLRDGEARDNDGNVYILGLANYLTQRFASDRQKPQITMRGGQPVALWQSTPSTPGQFAPAPASQGSISLSSEAGDVYVQATLPTAPPANPQRQKLMIILAVAVLLGGIMLCGLLLHVIHLI